MVERLKPNGVLLIWDFLPHGPRHQHQHHDGHGHNHHNHHQHKDDQGQSQSQGHDVYHSVMHHGFSEPRMREIFTAAGASADFQLEVIGGGFVIGHGQHHQQKQQQEDGQTATVTAASGEWDDGDQKSDGKDKEAFRRRVFFARGTKSGVGA